MVFGSALYIQGLARMQAASQNDQVSWLQVGGKLKKCRPLVETLNMFP